MSAANIRATAEQIAEQLEGLEGVNEAFIFAKPISAMQLGDALVAVSGTSPPHTMGADAYQTVVFSVLIKLGSGMVDIDGGAELQDRIRALTSAAPGEGIIGALRAQEELNPFGAPRVTEDGIEVVYDETADDNILTLLECSVTANIRVS